MVLIWPKIGSTVGPRCLQWFLPYGVAAVVALGRRPPAWPDRSAPGTNRSCADRCSCAAMRTGARPCPRRAGGPLAGVSGVGQDDVHHRVRAVVMVAGHVATATAVVAPVVAPVVATVRVAGAVVGVSAAGGVEVGGGGLVDGVSSRSGNRAASTGSCLRLRRG